MRLVSLKSFCLIAGFVVPCLGAASQSEAGIIPWVYDTIFGYGGGGGRYAGGRGGMNSNVGYGYGGWGGGYAYAPAYSPVVYSAPAYAPMSGSYTSLYGSEFGWGGEVVSNSCCPTYGSPTLATDDCGVGTSTEVELSRPAGPEPTPVDKVPTKSIPKKTPGEDHFTPLSPGERVPAARPENLEGINRGPTPRSIPTENEGLNAPIEGEPENTEGLKKSNHPSGNAVAIRYAPEVLRFAPKASRLRGNVVRSERPVQGPVANESNVATR